MCITITNDFNKFPTFSFLQDFHCLTQLALSYQCTCSIVAEFMCAFLEAQVLLSWNKIPIKHQTGISFHSCVGTQGYLPEPLFPNCFELQQLLKGLFFSPHHNHLGSFGRDLYTQLSIHHSVLAGITEETNNK